MTIVYDMPETEYRAHTDHLSGTGCKTILRSPKQYRHEIDNPRTSDAFNFGHLVHALVLDQPHNLTPRDWDGRTRPGKERVAEVEAQGLVPISLEKWVAAHDAAHAVLSHRKANALLSGGSPEVSVFAKDDDGTGIKMRGRFDYLHLDSLLVDLKTSENAEPWAFASSAATYGYHVQQAHYQRLAMLNGLDPEDFVFVVVEKAPPHLVSVIRLGGESAALGQDKARHAREIYRDCSLFDLWPDWAGDGADPEEIITVDLPRWAFL
jgi:hypothetical protein